MGRSFISAGSQYLSAASVPVNTAPLSMACWFNTASRTIAQTLVSIANSGSTNEFTLLISSAFVEARCNGAGIAATTTTFPAASTWNHAAGVFAASNSRAAYLNGASKGTNTATQNPTGLNVTAVGRTNTSSPGSYFNGSLAEVALWACALTDAEVAALATGINAYRVRPASIVAYWPLWGLFSPEIDYSGAARNLTVTGATVANHAPVALWTPRWRTPCDVAGAAPTASLWRRTLTATPGKRPGPLTARGL